MIDENISAAWVETDHGRALVPGNATPEQVAELLAEETEPEPN